MLTISDCLTIMVASGRGQRCNEFRSQLRDYLLNKDESGELRVSIHKYGREKNAERHKEICIGIGKVVSPMLKDIHPHFFCEEMMAKRKSNAQK